MQQGMSGGACEGRGVLQAALRARLEDTEQSLVRHFRIWGCLPPCQSSTSLTQGYPKQPPWCVNSIPVCCLGV